MRTLFLIIISIFLTSCAVRKEKLTVWLSDIENYQEIITHEDSLIIYPKIDTTTIEYKEKIAKSKEFFEKCEKTPGDCIIESMEIFEPKSEYPGGMYTLRKSVFEKTMENLPKRIKPGETRIKLVIDKEGYNHPEIIKYNNKKMKNIMEQSILKLRKWNPARRYCPYYNKTIKVSSQIEFSVFVERKKSEI